MSRLQISWGFSEVWQALAIVLAWLRYRQHVHDARTIQKFILELYCLSSSGKKIDYFSKETCKMSSLLNPFNQLFMSTGRTVGRSFSFTAVKNWKSWIYLNHAINLLICFHFSLTHTFAVVGLLLQEAVMTFHRCVKADLLNVEWMTHDFHVSLAKNIRS